MNGDYYIESIFFWITQIIDFLFLKLEKRCRGKRWSSVVSYRMINSAISECRVFVKSVGNAHYDKSKAMFQIICTSTNWISNHTFHEYPSICETEVWFSCMVLGCFVVCSGRNLHLLDLGKPSDPQGPAHSGEGACFCCQPLCGVIQWEF